MNTENSARIIVVGIDYSDGSKLALTQAFELATIEGNIELHALQVVVQPVVPSAVAHLVEHVRKGLDAFLSGRPRRKRPGQVVCHVRVDDPAHELAQLAADLEADMIIVGSRGRRAVARILVSSISEAVVRLAPCPVLVVRPKAVPRPSHRAAVSPVRGSEEVLLKPRVVGHG